MQRMVIDTLPPNVKLTGDAQEKIVNFQPFLCGFKIFHNLDPYFVWCFSAANFFLHFFASEALDPDPDRYSA